MHTALVSGWFCITSLYELFIFDYSDFIFNPLWRQGSFVLPFVSRLGVISSLFNWCIGIEISNYSQFISNIWKFESVLVSHLLLSGLFILSSFWHWSFWDLKVFIFIFSGKLSIDLIRVFGIHLLSS